MANPLRELPFVSQRLIVMVKEPRLGAVKTRLAREIGASAATRFYRTVSANIVRRLGADPRWRLQLAIAPDRALACGMWVGEAERVPQGRGDIGERMLRLLLAARAGRAVLVGSDIPAIRPGHIAAAFEALTRSDLVFGPAIDGGFWLVGLRRGRAPEGLFRNVRWSGPHALADTLATLANRKVALAGTLADVDDRSAYVTEMPAGTCVTCRIMRRDQSVS
jgi:rSAM/selenodomain-associated transferase 1